MGARYSHQAGYTVAKRQVRRQAVRTVSRRMRFGPTTSKFIGLAVLAVLGIFVLAAGSSGKAISLYRNTQINQSLSDEQQQVDDLKVQIERQKTIAAQASAAGGMEQTQSVDFVAPGDEKGNVAGVATQKP